MRRLWLPCSWACTAASRSRCSRKRPPSVWSVSALAKRKLVQWCSALLYNLNWQGFGTGRIYQGDLKTACVPGLNCYSCPGAVGACPVGALQSSLSGVMPRFPFYVLGLLLLFALLFGRFICGWLCPFGLVQELVYKIPTAKIRKNVLTERLCYGKYAAALLLVVLFPLLLFLWTGIGEPVFCKYVCPAGTLEAAIPLLSLDPFLASAVSWLTAWKFIILGVFLVAMIFVYRPFCRFLCPLGAWYGCFNSQAAFGITVDQSRCTHCGACASVCPMDVKLAGDRECISCGSCRPVCPVQAISYRQPGKSFYQQEEKK